MMSWTYTGNPKDSKKDECRFLLGDTLEESPIMQDEEIQYIIDTCDGNENKLKYLLFFRAATLFARDCKKSLGPQSEDPTERIKFFNDQADYYKKQCTVSGLSLPRYTHGKVFYKDMHSNPPYPKPGGTYYV